MCNLTLQDISSPWGTNNIAATIKQLSGSFFWGGGLPFAKVWFWTLTAFNPYRACVLAPIPHIPLCRVMWFKSTDTCSPAGTEMTLALIDYFQPFSRYIIVGLSSSLYSSYQRSITAKPQIESCNYPDCHLIAALLSALSLQVLLTHHRDRGKKRPAYGTACNR